MIHLLLVLLPGGIFAQTASKVLVATGTDVITSVVSPGTIACIGGTPGTNPQGPPCSPGTTRFLMSYRNALGSHEQVSGSAASLIQGTYNIVTHCNMDGNYYGHCWGHFVLTVPGAEGHWEGSWSGVFDIATNNLSYSGTAYGNGGKLEGLQLRIEWAATGPGPTGPEQRATFIARVSGK
jgi:hypothetical protein